MIWWPSGSDDYTPLTGLHPQNENTWTSGNARIGAYYSKEVEYGEMCTGSKGSFHASGRTHSMSDYCSRVGVCVSVNPERV
ncbi:hypothetical protein JCM10550A_23370 [Methanogenium cariaci]